MPHIYNTLNNYRIPINWVCAGILMLAPVEHAAARDNCKTNKLYFIENKGQVTDQDRKPRTDIQYKIETDNGPDIFIGAGAIHYQFKVYERSCENFAKLETRPYIRVGMDKVRCTETGTYRLYRMDVEVIGANANILSEPSTQREYYENYYIAGCVGETAHTFEKITYRNIYPNIDWVLTTGSGRLKHEFVVREGGKVSDIRIRYKGQTGLNIGTDGSLIALTPMGNVTEQAPVSIQEDGKKVVTRFKLDEDILSYEVAQFSGELTIDPTLLWGTYYGDVEDEDLPFIAKDAFGNLYMTGHTQSSTSIATTGAFQQVFQDVSNAYDVFLAKFDDNGTRLWATYYGGENEDAIYRPIPSPTGDVYIVGLTFSNTILSTPGAHQTTYDASGGNSVGYIAKFNNSGIRQWGTYYGGSGDDRTCAGAIDPAGDLVIAGWSANPTQIATAGTHQPTLTNTIADGYIAKFSSSGTRIWGTYYGGSLLDAISDVAVDGAGNIYVSGNTYSNDGIASPGSHQETYAGSTTFDSDCFLAKFNSSGIRLWGTYYGGTLEDTYGIIAYSAATDNIYLSGMTTSANGIATPGSHKASNSMYSDGFLAKFSSSGVRSWGTYFGGNFGEDQYAIDVVGDQIFIAGASTSTMGLPTAGALKPTVEGGKDGYIANFNAAGVLEYASYFGGPGADIIYDITSDNTGGVYIAGITKSSSGIATPGTHDNTYAGGGLYDIFYAKFNGFAVSVPGLPMRAVDMRVYPNPTSGNITVETNKDGTLIITSVDGRSRTVSLNTGKTAIALSGHFLPGILFCRFLGIDGSSGTATIVHTPER